MSAAIGKNCRNRCNEINGLRTRNGSQTDHLNQNCSGSLQGTSGFFNAAADAFDIRAYLSPPSFPSPASERSYEAGARVRVISNTRTLSNGWTRPRMGQV